MRGSTAPLVCEARHEESQVALLALQGAQIVAPLCLRAAQNRLCTPPLLLRPRAGSAALLPWQAPNPDVIAPTPPSGYVFGFYSLPPSVSRSRPLRRATSRRTARAAASASYHIAGLRWKRSTAPRRRARARGERGGDGAGEKPVAGEGLQTGPRPHIQTAPELTKRLTLTCVYLCVTALSQGKLPGWIAGCGQN
jgi:hypothetical protein